MFVLTVCALIVRVSATRPVIVLVLFCAVCVRRKVIWGSIVHTRGSVLRSQQDDVAVESDDDDGLSDCSYGQGADYLLPASPLISETPSPADVPVDDTSSLPDAVLSDSSNSPLVSSPDSPVLNTDGLVKSVQSVPDPPRHRIPALLSDSLSAASRRSSSPLSVKPTPSLLSEPVADPSSAPPDSLDNGMDVTMDLKRKSADASRSAQRKERKTLLISEFSFHA